MKLIFFACVTLFIIGGPAGKIMGQTVSADSPARLVSDSALSEGIDTSNLKPENSGKVVHIYRMNYWLSGAFCAVATGSDYYSISLIKNKPVINSAELQALNPSALNGLDRWALQQDPSKRQAYLHAADYSLPLIILSPGLLSLNKNIRKDWFRILMMYYEMHAVTYSIYNYSFFGPTFQNRFRPVTYYTQLPLADRNNGDNRNSMYSGHAATAVASTIFLVKVYSDYHPHMKNKFLWYAAATVPGFAMGFLRVKGLAHFPSDALMGLTIGTACGVLIPELHRFNNKKVSFGVSSSSTGGAGLGMLWNMDWKSVANN